jgi:excisionase family DNA binding protein
VAKRVGMDATETHTLTVAQAADALGVSERTVWRYLKAGRLDGVTVGPVGGQRTLVDAAGIAAMRASRTAPDPEAGELRDRLERALADLAAAQSERDELARRVATLQRALARPRREGVVVRAAAGLAAAVVRLRSPRARATA